jgi:hypothetical protein
LPVTILTVSRHTQLPRLRTVQLSTAYHSSSLSHFVLWCTEYVPDVCDVCGGLYTAGLTTNSVGLLCHLCNWRFPNSEKLIAHSLRHTHLQPFWCRMCERGYSRRIKLAKHMAEQHPTTEPASTVDPESFVPVDLFELLDLISLEDMPLPQVPEHAQGPDGQP